jgi:hypothetical protein
VPDEPQHEEFSDSWIDAIAASHKTNLWIPAERIASANIHVGLMIDDGPGECAHEGWPQDQASLAPL